MRELRKRPVTQDTGKKSRHEGIARADGVDDLDVVAPMIDPVRTVERHGAAVAAGDDDEAAA